ncbi:hypothetical protein LSAT2_016925 [Lamellibrachia satsuma]|nr:hypothetical protein LSAT2_016925 [Lamellibrachia satsuma]
MFTPTPTGLLWGAFSFVLVVIMRKDCSQRVSGNRNQTTGSSRLSLEHRNVSKMAASGIQEHNEARRKEAFIMRRAHLRKSNSLEYGGIPQSRDELAVGRIRGVEVPERQWWREQLLGAHSHHRTPQSGNREGQMGQFEQHAIQYSAKLPNRYNNIDYTSQW